MGYSWLCILVEVKEMYEEDNIAIEFCFLCTRKSIRDYLVMQLSFLIMCILMHMQTSI